MRVGIIQTNYIPFRGYFDFINSVDLFVFYDDILLSQGRSWRNRNRIKTPDGPKWLTVPLNREAQSRPKISEVRISYQRDWQRLHLKTLRHNYARSPFFNDLYDIMMECFRHKDDYLSKLNYRLIKSFCRYLGIGTNFVWSWEYNLKGNKTERLIDLLVQLNATHYLSGPAAADYIEPDLFLKAGIGLEYKTYDYLPYPQLFPPFEDNLSVIDLIANVGPRAYEYLHCKEPNQVIVPSSL